MIKCAYFPEKEFASKQELFAALRLNAEKIIALKKADIHKSFYKGYPGDGFLLKDFDEASKVGPHMKEGFVYPIINTTRYVDSHDDCHLDGIWDTSAKQQEGKIYYVSDHELKIESIIAWPEDVKIMVKTIPWSFVGKNYEGNTQALIYEIDKTKIVNTTAKQIINEKRPVQNSVRMQYVNIKLAMNSDRKEDVEYKQEYDKHISTIANKEVAEEKGYFFPVYEAKIIKEGSMVVFGSNDATAIRQKLELTAADTITAEKIEPVNPTTHKQTRFINPNLF